jgi:hypothetical protein
MRDHAVSDPSLAFLTIDRDLAGDGQCTVRGRAYGNIYVGDVLLARKPSGASGSIPRFVVTGISTYGRTVESLERMLTGTLTLQGQPSNAIKPGLVLVYADAPAAGQGDGNRPA